jgi:hypothetical protein
MSGTEGQPDDIDRLMDSIYQTYGRPLETEHRDEFAVIAPDGRYVLGATRTEALEKALQSLGPGHFLYRIGHRVVGTAL